MFPTTFGIRWRVWRWAHRNYNPANTEKFWRWTGLFSGGHATYAKDELEKGPFVNPASMIEDIFGHDPSPLLTDGRSESEFWADVWKAAGWWDPFPSKKGQALEYSPPPGDRRVEAQMGSEEYVEW